MKGKKGLTRIVRAFGYSINGFRIAWRQEAAFRQELTMAAILLPIAFWLDVTTLERIALISVLVFVIVVELINSAIENAIDRIGTERHQLSGQAKDLGSAAVLVALALTAFVWITIVWETLVST